MAAAKLIFALLTVIVLAQVSGWPYIDQVIYVLLGLLVAAFIWSRVSVYGITVSRQIGSDRCQIGQFITEDMTLKNRGLLPKLWLEVFDLSSLPGHQVSRVVHVRGRREIHWQVETLCQRRGQFFVGPLIVRSGDPFGIFSRLARFPERQSLLVYPATEDISTYRLPEGQLSGGAASSRRTPTTTNSVSGLREYGSGDALNRISWTASARTGRLMVKEFDNDPAADVWIVLDMDHATHIGAAYSSDHPAWRPPPVAWLDTTEEYAVTVAASLARRLLDSGRNVGLLTSTEQPLVIQPDRGDRQLSRILESLAVVSPSGEQSLSEMLMNENRRLAGPAALIVVTAATDTRWVQTLVELGGRRTRASVVVIEPDTFGPATSSIMVLQAVTAAGIPASFIKCGDLIAPALTSLTPNTITQSHYPVGGGSRHG